MAAQEPAAPRPLTRAERFEDDKRRIIESCFSKLEADGITLTETYITHVRVTEDAAFPSSPPPPDSAAQNKKIRVIIVAVRCTGRVRMHKARENANGTFSIGKTWNLEELASIESYSSPTTEDTANAQQKQWAGAAGFTVTISKPYYWHAGTPKEKEFFILSLVKIYRKYTQGRVPRLIGFDPRETQQMLAGPSQAGKPTPPLQQQTPKSPDPQLLPQSAPPESLKSSRPSAISRQESPSDSRTTLPRQPKAGPRAASGDERPRQRREGSAQSQETLLLPRQERNITASSQDTLPSFRSGQNQSPTPRQRAQSPYDQKRSESINASGDRSSPGPQGAIINLPDQSVSQPSTSRLQSAKIASPPQFAFPGEVPPRRRPQSPAGFPIPAEATSPRAQYPVRSAEALTVRGNQASEIDRDAKKTPTVLPSTMDRWRTGGSEFSTAAEPPVTANGDIHRPLPERRRPPLHGPKMSIDAHSIGQSSVENWTTPLHTPSIKDGVEGTSATQEGHSDLPPQSQQTQDDYFPSSEVPAAKSKTQELQPPLRNAVNGEKREEDHRPGLGPMVRKQSQVEVPDRTGRAPTGPAGFKPRAGGAGEKLFGAKPNVSDGADGITGVFTPPLISKAMSSDTTPRQSPRVSLEDRPYVESAEVPGLRVTSPPRSSAEQPSRAESLGQPLPLSVGRSLSPDDKLDVKAPLPLSPNKQRRRSPQRLKYLSVLDIDPSLLEGRVIAFDSVLNDFGWTPQARDGKKLDELEAAIKRELGRVEAGTWLGHLEQKDERVEAVEKLLDRTIAECDELEGLLTLYGVELSTLNDDVAYIEAQSQGLQVQSANQKLLQTELQKLVETISIDSRHLDPLRTAKLQRLDDLEAVEKALVLLYRAMATIQPSFKASSDRRPSSSQVSGRDSVGRDVDTSALAQMRALQEKKDTYKAEATAFLQRLRGHLDQVFHAELQKTQEALGRRSKDTAHITHLDPTAHDLARTSLWQYSPVLLFARETDIRAWEALLKVYQSMIRPLYQSELRENLSAWKALVRKTTGEDNDLLFTSQDKDSEGALGTAARRLTVKRSQTLAKSLRTNSGEKSSALERNRDGRLFPFETFSNFLDEATPLVFMEQNFIVDCFHATSLEPYDFPDLVSSSSPSERHGTNLQARRLHDPDHQMANRVHEVMQDAFPNLSTDLQNFVEWAIAGDNLQGVGALAAVERKLRELSDTNQDFLIGVFEKCHAKLSALFAKFLEAQIRAIDETKVKIKKRKGVIGFIRTFPNFSAAIENMIPPAEETGGTTLEVRSLVDEAYARLNRAMFASLKVIAKENPSYGVSGGGSSVVGDLEDKEALNYHILHLENMNYYVQEVDERGVKVLGKWKGRAMIEMAEHLEAYLRAVLSRPLGKLIDFLESTETLLSSLPPTSAASSLTSRPSHSRSSFKKILSSYDAKSVKHDIYALRKRIEKHFGSGTDSTSDEPSSSHQQLVSRITKECEKRYYDVLNRVKRVVDVVYEGSVELEFGLGDVSHAFKK